MNLNEVDWESLENVWGFLFKEGSLVKTYRRAIRDEPSLRITEELWTLVSAYEKFGELVCE